LTGGHLLVVRESCLASSCLVAVQELAADGSKLGDPREVGRGTDASVPPGATHLMASQPNEGPDRVYAYGPALYRSDDAGKTWRKVVQYPAGRVEAVFQEDGIDWIVTTVCATATSCHVAVSSEPELGDPVIVRDVPGSSGHVEVSSGFGRAFLRVIGPDGPRVYVFDAATRTISPLPTSPCGLDVGYVTAAPNQFWAACQTDVVSNGNEQLEQATKTFWASTDEGRTWHKRGQIGSRVGFVRTIVPVSNYEAWAAMSSGGYVTHTTDGGASWTVEQDQPGFEAAFGVMDLEVLADRDLIVLTADPVTGLPLIARRTGNGGWASTPA
jgi:hypothetical protein